MPYVIPELPAARAPGAPPSPAGPEWYVPWRGDPPDQASPLRPVVVPLIAMAALACWLVILSIVGATWRVLAG